jgi:hypothetical protein
LYIPCANPDVIKKYRWGNKTWYEKKALAFEKCVKQTIDTYNEYYGKQFMKNKRLSVWFSDDSSKNIESVKQIIINKLIYKYPNISFMMYDTKEPTMIRKETIHPKSDSKELF